MAIKFLAANNAQTTLAAPIGTGDTAITVLAGTGVEFPSPAANEQFAFTLLDAVSGLVNEIVYCTSRTGDALTVVRAREGTTAKEWLAGDTGANFMTAGMFAALAQLGDVASRTNYWAAGGSANALTITPAPVIEAYFTGLTFQVGVASNNTGAATLNVNGLGTRAIQDQSGAALTANQLVAGRIQQMVYTGAAFRLVTTPPISTFITALAAKSPLLLTDQIPVDGGAGPQRGTLAQVAVLVQEALQADTFFLGLM